MLHTMELVVKVVRDPRSSASHAHTRAALVTVATTVLATRLLASVHVVPRRVNSSMVLFASLVARCSHTSLIGLVPWTSGAGPHAKRTSCSQESSVTVLVMHSTILHMASALVHVKALHQARRPSALSTATTRIGGRSSTLLGVSSAERTTLLLGSSGVTAPLCTASRWPNAAKCNAVYGTNANGWTSRVLSPTGTARRRTA